MTSIANAIITYGFLKHWKPGSSWPVGAAFLAAAIVDIMVAIIISAGI